MASEFDGFQTDTRERERVAIDPGSYGTSQEPGLKIVHYIGSKQSVPDPELTIHDYLVARANGDRGTAFLSLNIKGAWLTPEAVSLAGSKRFPSATEAGIEAFRGQLEDLALARARANNTPDDLLAETTTKLYSNALKQVQIALAQLFNLYDWQGVERMLSISPELLVGTTFSGKIAAGRNGTTRVKSIYARKRSRG